MSSSSNSDLIGREIVLIVSSPWDYKAPDGTNSEYARITSFDVEKNCLVAESHREIYLPRKDVRGTRLEIHMRHSRDETFEHVLAGYHVGVNVMLVDKINPDSGGMMKLLHVMAGCGTPARCGHRPRAGGQ